MLFLLGDKSPNYGHDLFMSICEMERVGEGELEVRFYIFRDNLKEALYGNPGAAEIRPEDAQKYIAEKTELRLDGQVAELRFQTLEYHKDQVRLIYRTAISPNQKPIKINLTNRLLLELFRTQVNMVYFVKNDGQRLVKMLDGSNVEAGFSG